MAIKTFEGTQPAFDSVKYFEKISLPSNNAMLKDKFAYSM